MLSWDAMPVYTFHCLSKDDVATSFVFHEFEDDAAARQHTESLFRNWTTCARIEVDCEGCEPFIVSRSESQTGGAARARVPPLR